MISFEIELGEHQTILLKQFTEQTMLIMPVDLHSPELPKAPDPVINEEFCGGIA